MKSFDISIIGAGVLGTTIAYWLSELFDCSIALIDQESQPSTHTSSRNTGVVHRPFYLDPEKKKTFARCAQKSFFLWQTLAAKFGLPWNQVGTLEVAIDPSQFATLEKYMKWGGKNGMEEKEIELLDSSQVRKLEPEVSCAGAIFSKTDTLVSYKSLTSGVFQMAVANGVTFLGDSFVRKLHEDHDGTQIEFDPKSSMESIRSSFTINAAGGNSVDLAHQMNLAGDYTDLHFRGEYWVVSEPFASRITRNIYSVAKYKEFPFLDPHFVQRFDGRREIGPNAVLVAGPYSYEGLANSPLELFGKLFESPIAPKFGLFVNPKFLSLAMNEWRSSLSKTEMMRRVKQFIPNLSSEFLKQRGLSGVRSSVIDRRGFVSEAIELQSDRSLHILNYNSPGATGAPAFSATIVERLIRKGYLGGLHPKNSLPDRVWDFENAIVHAS